MKKLKGNEGMPPMYSMFITATAAEVMVAQREVTPYLYIKLPYNYRGFHNNGIDFRVIERGLEPSNEFEDEVNLPPMGLRLQAEVKGVRAVTNGQVLRLKHTLRHMVNYPDHVLPGWRHAAVYIRVANLQHMLAQYVASLLHKGAPLDFITLEWHSPHVKNIALADPLHPDRKQQPPVRIFMNRTLFDSVVKGVWSNDFGGGFRPGIWQESTRDDARHYSLQYITPGDLAQYGVIRDVASHCEIACISLGSDATMRKAVTMCEKIWRCCGGMNPTYNESHLYDNRVRVVCFSGEINGRQQPNKSESHTTVLTDFVHDSTAAQHAQAQQYEAFTKAMSVPTFSQIASRLCGVTLHVLANPPILWADCNAQECLQQYRGQMRELIDMRCDANGASLANIFCGGVIDRRRHPYLADLKDALEAIVENTSHRRKPQSGQVTAMNTPASRKSAGVSIVHHTNEVLGAAGTVPASDLRTPPPLLGPQFTPDQKTLAPPRDPNAAARMREEDAKAREGQVLANLKTTARLELFNRGNQYPDFTSWRELVGWYKTHAEQDAHGLPDWATPIPQSKMASMPDSVQRANLFGPKNKWSTQMQPGHERFFNHNAEQDHYVMAEFLQAAMNSLRDTRTRGAGDTYDIYDLWLGTKPGKYRQCLRDVLRLVLQRAPEGKLPSVETYEGVFSCTKQLLNADEMEQILNDRGLRGRSTLSSFYLSSYTYSPGHQAWAYPPLVKPKLGNGDDYFYLSKDMVTAVNKHNRTSPESRQLSLANLRRDPPSGGGGGVMQAKEQLFGNGIVVKLRNEDIATAATEAVVNAANTKSFTMMDKGVSGALRIACGGLSACNRPKKLYLDGGEWSAEEVLVPEGRTGVEPVDRASNLGDQGVKFLLHTVGPQWTASPTEEESYCMVKGIREAVSHALCVAEALECRSVTLPPISGGLFALNNERSKHAARSALISEVKLWANNAAELSFLKEVIIVDNSIDGFRQLLSAWELEMSAVRLQAGEGRCAAAAAGPSISAPPARNGKALAASNGKAPAHGKRQRAAEPEAVDSDSEDGSSLDVVEIQQAIYESSMLTSRRRSRVARSTD
mmetsp:Transcript_2173/g.7089  ORF Transcript_2173/g.7089 Transcript_2173/m.7089 type:complete len:1082 (+) Transcript_2173:227-3472(+)